MGGEPGDLGDARLLERLGKPRSLGGERLGGECPGGEGLCGPELRLSRRQSGLLRGADDGGQLLADGQAGVGRSQDLGDVQGLLGLCRGQNLALDLGPGLGSGQGHGLSLDLGHLRKGNSDYVAIPHIADESKGSSSKFFD